MLNAMGQLGRLLRRTRGHSDTEAFVQPMPPLPGRDEGYVLVVNIDTVAMCLTFEPIKCEPSDKERLARELLWIGNADGANSPQWTATTNTFAYLISQTIVNLHGMLADDSELRTRLQCVRDACMVDLGPQQGSEERYRYVLHPERLLNMPAEQWDSLLHGARDETRGSIHGKALVSALARAVLQHQGYSTRQIYLFTLAVDGKRVADHPDYQALVAYNKIEAAFADARLGVCSACGDTTMVTANLTRMKFKYYNTDKMSFASGVDKKRFNRNIALCSPCYTACLAAESFVKGHMATKIGHLRFYIIPEIFEPIPPDLDPRVWSQHVRNQVESTLNFTGIANLEEELAWEQSEYEHLGYVTNLLFHVWNKAELHLYNVVRDVPETRFHRLQQAFLQSKRKAHDVLGPRSSAVQIQWEPNFTALYKLIPLNKSNQSAEYRRILQVFDAILVGQAVSYRLLLQSFCRLIQIRRFGGYTATNVEKPPIRRELEYLVDDVLMANVVLLCLRDLEQLAESPLKGRASNLEPTNNELNDKVNAQAFLQTIGYRASHEALYWLGSAIASVATAQWSNGFTAMPVLEQINYRGMNAADVVRLVGRVEDAFRHYKLFGAGADTLFRMHAAFAQALDTSAVSPRWKREYPMTDEEAVFYILSGFAVKHKEILSHRRKDRTNGPSNEVPTDCAVEGLEASTGGGQ